MEHVNTQINERVLMYIVLMYLSAEKVIRPSVTPDVSVYKGIMSCFSFLFLGVVRHCENTIHLLVQDVLPCVRVRSWIPVEWIRSLGARLYAYEADLLDRRPVHSHNISRD